MSVGLTALLDALAVKLKLPGPPNDPAPAQGKPVRNAREWLAMVLRMHMDAADPAAKEAVASAAYTVTLNLAADENWSEAPTTAAALLEAANRNSAVVRGPMMGGRRPPSHQVGVSTAVGPSAPPPALPTLAPQQPRQPSNPYEGPLQRYADSLAAKLNLARPPPPSSDFERIRSPVDWLAAVLHIASLCPDLDRLEHYIHGANKVAAAVLSSGADWSSAPYLPGDLEKHDSPPRTVHPAFPQFGGRPQQAPPAAAIDLPPDRLFAKLSNAFEGLPLYEDTVNAALARLGMAPVGAAALQVLRDAVREVHRYDADFIRGYELFVLDRVALLCCEAQGVVRWSRQDMDFLVMAPHNHDSTAELKRLIESLGRGPSHPAPPRNHSRDVNDSIMASRDAAPDMDRLSGVPTLPKFDGSKYGNTRAPPPPPPATPPSSTMGGFDSILPQVPSTSHGSVDRAYYAPAPHNLQSAGVHHPYISSVVRTSASGAPPPPLAFGGVEFMERKLETEIVNRIPTPLSDNVRRWLTNCENYRNTFRDDQLKTKHVEWTYNELLITLRDTKSRCAWNLKSIKMPGEIQSSTAQPAYVAVKAPPTLQEMNAFGKKVVPLPTPADLIKAKFISTKTVKANVAVPVFTLGPKVPGKPPVGIPSKAPTKARPASTKPTAPTRSDSEDSSTTASSSSSASSSESSDQRRSPARPRVFAKQAAKPPAGPVAVKLAGQSSASAMKQRLSQVMLDVAVNPVDHSPSDTPIDPTVPTDAAAGLGDDEPFVAAIVALNADIPQHPDPAETLPGVAVKVEPTSEPRQSSPKRPKTRVETKKRKSGSAESKPAIIKTEEPPRKPHRAEHAALQPDRSIAEMLSLSRRRWPDDMIHLSKFMAPELIPYYRGLKKGQDVYVVIGFRSEKLLIYGRGKVYSTPESGCLDVLYSMIDGAAVGSGMLIDLPASKDYELLDVRLANPVATWSRSQTGLPFTGAYVWSDDGNGTMPKVLLSHPVVAVDVSSTALHEDEAPPPQPVSACPEPVVSQKPATVMLDDDDDDGARVIATENVEGAADVVIHLEEVESQPDEDLPAVAEAPCDDDDPHVAEDCVGPAIAAETNSSTVSAATHAVDSAPAAPISQLVQGSSTDIIVADSSPERDDGDDDEIDAIDCTHSGLPLTWKVSGEETTHLTAIEPVAAEAEEPEDVESEIERTTPSRVTDEAEHDPDEAEHDPDEAEHDPDEAEHDPVEAQKAFDHEDHEARTASTTTAAVAAVIRDMAAAEAEDTPVIDSNVYKGDSGEVVFKPDLDDACADSSASDVRASSCTVSSADDVGEHRPDELVFDF